MQTRSKASPPITILGRTLLFAGHKQVALTYFNPTSGCLQVVALCNEISEENRKYIMDTIDAGADLELRDEQGYSALESAVYNGDDETTKIIECGLRNQLRVENYDVHN